MASPLPGDGKGTASDDKETKKLSPDTKASTATKKESSAEEAAKLLRKVADALEKNPGAGAKLWYQSRGRIESLANKSDPRRMFYLWVDETGIDGAEYTIAWSIEKQGQLEQWIQSTLCEHLERHSGGCMSAGCGEMSASGFEDMRKSDRWIDYYDVLSSPPVYSEIVKHWPEKSKETEYLDVSYAYSVLFPTGRESESE